MQLEGIFLCALSERTSSPYKNKVSPIKIQRYLKAPGILRSHPYFQVSELQPKHKGVLLQNNGYYATAVGQLRDLFNISSCHYVGKKWMPQWARKYLKSGDLNPYFSPLLGARKWSLFETGVLSLASCVSLVLVHNCQWVHLKQVISLVHSSSARKNKTNKLSLY